MQNFLLNVRGVFLCEELQNALLLRLGVARQEDVATKLLGFRCGWELLMRAPSDEDDQST